MVCSNNAVIAMLACINEGWLTTRTGLVGGEGEGEGVKWQTRGRGDPAGYLLGGIEDLLIDGLVVSVGDFSELHITKIEHGQPMSNANLQTLHADQDNGTPSSVWDLENHFFLKMHEIQSQRIHRPLDLHRI